MASRESGLLFSLERGLGIALWVSQEKKALTSRERPSEYSSPSFVVQSLSHVPVFVILWTAAHQASLSFTISHSLLKLMSIESAMHIPHTRLAKEAQQGSSSPACRLLSLPLRVCPCLNKLSLYFLNLSALSPNSFASKKKNLKFTGNTTCLHRAYLS